MRAKPYCKYPLLHTINEKCELCVSKAPRTTLHRLQGSYPCCTVESELCLLLDDDSSRITLSGDSLLLTGKETPHSCYVYD
ncbi:hypothetical protein TNCV_1596421 [Trichonephila clavipes]|nr:hypothetical protein TNCV_1596421 [Trichonephila clavipes]